MDKKRILIIDDEADFCTLAKKNIERTGEFEVFIALNGEEGIRLVREIKPDLVLLDIVMPEVDGADVASAIKADDSIKDTPIVFLTGIIREGESGFTKGYAVLSKTAPLKELIACIKENIKQGQ
jgi:CheY-like chemotaxis protein